MVPLVQVKPRERVIFYFYVGNLIPLFIALHYFLPVSKLFLPSPSGTDPKILLEQLPAPPACHVFHFLPPFLTPFRR